MKTISRYLMALLAIAFFQQNIIAQSGNVGVNQNSPASSLDVNGNLSIGSTYSGSNAAPANGAIIEGNVGIGTINPATYLHVNAASGPAFISAFTSPNDWGEILVGCNNKFVGFGSNESGYGYIGTKSPADFYLRTNDGVKIAIEDSTGNVGIGTITPASILHLSKPGEAELSIQSTSPFGRRWTLQSNPASSFFKTQFQIIDRTANESRLGIDSLGRVGIGTTSPANKLDVEGGLAVGSTYSGTSAAPTNGAIIEGNVGIGTISTAGKFHVSTTGFPSCVVDGSSIFGTWLSIGNSGGGNWFQMIATGSGNGEGAGKLLFNLGSGPNSVTSNIMTLDHATQYVGIGTTSPANKLDVEGGLAVGSTYSGTYTAPSNGAIIQGNMGIGINNPGTNLHVNAATGPAAMAYFSSPSNWGEIHVACSDKKVDLGVNENGIGYMGTKSAADLHLRTNDGVKVTIQDATGNVGIGNSSPPAKLSITGQANSPSIPGTTSTGILRVASSAFGGAEALDFGKMAVFPYSAWMQAGYNGATTDPLAIQPLGGYVGIGITSPIAPLHVTGVSGNNGSTNIRYFNYNSITLQTSTNWMGQTAILANGNICATESFISGASFNFSDARIKNIIGRSDGADDLDRLNRIEITRYIHKDTIAKGSAVQTKVIAQQLEQVMPEAVSYTREFIPDVMQVVERIDFQENTFTVTLPKPHELKVGDHVKCLDEKGQELFVDVLAAPNENTVVFKTDCQPSQLFIYGKQVDDFHIVDYDAIAMLNVSATQELAKRLVASEQSVEELQAEVAALKSQLSEMDTLKKQVAQLAASYPRTPVRGSHEIRQTEVRR
ncbi:MAG: tail fiber domain-containing protein [Saprospiraceae bacterium]